MLGELGSTTYLTYVKLEAHKRQSNRLPISRTCPKLVSAVVLNVGSVVLFKISRFQHWALCRVFLML